MTDVLLTQLESFRVICRVFLVHCYLILLSSTVCQALGKFCLFVLFIVYRPSQTFFRERSISTSKWLVFKINELTYLKVTKISILICKLGSSRLMSLTSFKTLFQDLCISSALGRGPSQAVVGTITSFLSFMTRYMYLKGLLKDKLAPR